MTIHPYHTTQPSINAKTHSTTQHTIARKAILNDIARNAVVDDEIIAPLELKIEVDETGTVIVKALEEDLNAGITGHHRRVIHVPLEKAYQRIVDASQRKTGLLERLYTERQQEANQWFSRSFLTATIGACILILSVFLPVLLYLLQLNTHILPIICFIITINIMNASITTWLFHQTQQANEQVDLYLKGLNEVRNFSMITQFIAQLTIDDTHKHLLQKLLIANSLGLPKQQTNLEAEASYKGDG
ncbi:hypothetical protein KDA_25080 [Dictyobacter alpinus]|uniref:Uncharacterized protein n=1 Tax=Dictyobacter alpinus TaxID=2014873 RepID=A0A402B6Q4_9CHLR|nr:hypothetical protein [Dictyobacter alpinus]GCE27024.1 hypothetical protein KDA_25080 [Dictyobacter alpinus]